MVAAIDVVVISDLTAPTLKARQPLLSPLHGPHPSPRESLPESFASEPITRLITTPFAFTISYSPQLVHPWGRQIRSNVSSVEPPGGWVDVVDELDEVGELLTEVLVVVVPTVVEVATTLVVEEVATGTAVEELLVEVLVVVADATVVVDEEVELLVVVVDATVVEVVATVVVDEEVVDASFGLGPSKAYTPSSCHCFPPKDPPPQTLRLQTIRLLALPTSK